MAELHIDTAGILKITPKALSGVRIGVFGSSGSGKGNTTATLIEEIVPYTTGMTIFDAHDEYWGLKEKYPFLRVGKNQPFRQGAERKSPPVDLEVNAGNAAQFAEQAFMKRIPVIVNLFYMSKDERQELVLKYTERLWQLNMSYGRPYWVVFDEAHNFIPEGKKTPELEQLTQFASEGRKFGFTMVFASQRTAKVDKNILSECDFLFLHRINIENDVRAYKGLLPAHVNRQPDLFITMQPGQAVVKWQNGNVPQFDVVQIRQRTTFHVGATPDAEEVAQPVLQTVDMSMLGDLGIKVSKAQPVPVAQSDRQLIDAEQKYKRLQRTHLLTVAALVAVRHPAAVLPALPALAPLPALPPIRAESALITGAGLSKQERAFNGLLRDVVRGCKYPFHIEILKYLTGREDLTMCMNDIARFVGLAESTVRDHPPIYLCTTLALLQRNKVGSVFYYRSAARETLAERFPDLPTDALVQKLLEVGN